MRLILLTALTMAAFAANSVLNRMALVDETTGPAAFALVRIGSAAAFLLVLTQVRSAGQVPWRSPGRMIGVLMLALYVIGFSFAYVTLETGTGALILFGGVQITMFCGAWVAHEKMPMARWAGAAIAFAGLSILLWPTSGVAPDLIGAILMAGAAIGWGVYSLLGRRAQDPLGSTAANFTLTLPIGILVFALWPSEISMRGAILATISGAVTSGAGYALWYSVLPRLAASVAGVAQLTVPVLAAVGGLIFLTEPLTLRFVLSAMLVLLGITISIKNQ